MPIYEYRCQQCQNVFEEWLKSFDDEAPNCPSCGGQAERIMSNTTFVLKGGGWYVTEYGNHKGDEGSVSAAHGDTAAGKQGDGHAPKAKASTQVDAKSAGQTDSKAAGQADTKPAAPTKPESKAATPASPASA